MEGEKTKLKHAIRVSVVVLGAAFLGSGCQTGTGQTASPVVSALDVAIEDDAADTQDEAPRPTYRDGYPSFAGTLTAANVQMSNEEAALLQQEMTQLAAARASGSISEAEYQKKLAQLRRLAAQHGAEVQAQIAK